jgi:hypothetical protein
MGRGRAGSERDAMSDPADGAPTATTPCPFCGSSDIRTDIPWEVEGEQGESALRACQCTCLGCWTGGPPVRRDVHSDADYAGLRAEAERRWNARADQLGAALAEVRALAPDAGELATLRARVASLEESLATRTAECAALRAKDPS